MKCGVGMTSVIRVPTQIHRGNMSGCFPEILALATHMRDGVSFLLPESLGKECEAVIPRIIHKCKINGPTLLIWRPCLCTMYMYMYMYITYICMYTGF